MQGAEQILQGLTAVANQNVWLAIAWHIAIAGGAIALLAGWRPPRLLAVFGLVIPLISVATLAWIYGNAFNGLVFSILAGVLFLLALRWPGARVSGGPKWSCWVGVVLAVFAWVYPHFLVDQPTLAYLYAAPTALVPGATLCLVIGFAMMANGFSSRLWSILLAGVGLFYGVFGALRLGVSLDWVLAVGALAFLVSAVQATPAVGEGGQTHTHHL